MARVGVLAGLVKEVERRQVGIGQLVESVGHLQVAHIDWDCIVA